MDSPEALASTSARTDAAAVGAALASSARRGARWRVGIGAAVVLVLAAVAVAVVAGLAAPRASVTELGPSSPAVGASPAVGFTAAPSPQPTGLVVHVVGAVAHPGVYALPAGSRAIDAVAAAGGFTRAADKAAQNLARKLVDGEQLSVPKKGAPAALGVPAGGSSSPGAGGDPSGGAAAGGLVDLNTADEAQLETLPHVGPVMAQKILDWRAQNGGFASVDDLQNVSGVGPKTFETLKPLVTV